MVGWVSAIDVIADDLGVERLHIGRCQDKVDFIARFIAFEAVECPDIVCIRMQCPKCIDHRGGIFNLGVVPAGLSFDESRPGAYSGTGVAPGDRAGDLRRIGQPERPARSNTNPAQDTHQPRAACSFINCSSFSFAAFAQLCRLGIPIALPSTYRSRGVIGFPPAGGIVSARISLYAASVSSVAAAASSQTFIGQ